jgi:3-hydroxyisobutyrate dehydrogenase-like beta-hydroxyacid dehydrogenase
MSAYTAIALIGFGEVGQILAADLAKAGVSKITAWDIHFTDVSSAPSLAVAASSVRQATSAHDAVADAELIISAVTAAQDLAAARSVAEGMKPGTVYLDLNSCSPGQKLAACEAITQGGGAYVEAAVMSPFPPKRLASPMLLGGPYANAFLGRAAPLGFTGAKAYSEVIGQAAATKLCRSVMIKGVEALLTESMLAARHYGVEKVVLDSLSDLLPLPDWRATAQYMISRSLEHGTRRAEEMREAAKTVAEAHVAPTMSQAIAERQDWAAGYGGAMNPDLIAMLDAVIQDTP